MNKPILVKPLIIYMDSYILACKEYADAGLSEYDDFHAKILLLSFSKTCFCVMRIQAEVSGFRQYVEKGQTILMPEFAWVEIGSVIRKKVYRKEDGLVFLRKSMAVRIESLLDLLLSLTLRTKKCYTLLGVK